MFVKLSDNHWGTKQSHFVPSCLWSCWTTIEVLNSLTSFHRVCEVVWQPVRYKKESHFVPSCLWSCQTTLEVLNSLTLPHRVCEVLRQPWKYSTVSLCHIVFVKLSKNTWCTKVSLCPVVFVKLSDNHLCTKQSHFVPSCLWSCLTTIEVINSLALSHHVCEVIWQPLRH